MTYHLEKLGVLAYQLFSSAVYYAYQSGIKYPKAISKGFGINSKTAIKYFNMLNLRSMREGAKVVERALLENAES